MALLLLCSTIYVLIVLSESSKQLSNDTILNYLNYQACVYGNIEQKFKYDNQTKLIQLITLVDNQQICAVSTGSSDPVGMTPCNPSELAQKWNYTSSQFFQSMAFGTCLDVYQQQGPEVDEWTCKSPSDPTATNQQWIFNGTQIISKVMIYGYFCLTSVPYQ